MVGEQEQWDIFYAGYALPVLTGAARLSRIPAASRKIIFLIHRETIPGDCSVKRLGRSH